MTRLLLMAIMVVFLLVPAEPSTAFESPLLFESPVWDGSDAVITAQTCNVYLLPSIRVGTPRE